MISGLHLYLCCGRGASNAWSQVNFTNDNQSKHDFKTFSSNINKEITIFLDLWWWWWWVMTVVLWGPSPLHYHHYDAGGRWLTVQEKRDLKRGMLSLSGENDDDKRCPPPPKNGKSRHILFPWIFPERNIPRPKTELTELNDPPINIQYTICCKTCFNIYE